MEEYAKTTIDFLKTFLKLPNGLPSHDAFGDIFATIHPIHFEPGRRCERLLGLDTGSV